MIAINTISMSWLARRSSTVFRLSGLLFLGYVGLKSIRLLTAITVPDAVSVVVGHIALLVPVLGLLGLYHRVRDGSPILSRIGAGMALASGVCSVVLVVTVVHLTLTMPGYPAIPEDAGQGLIPVFLGVLLLFASIVSILLGCLCIGLAGHRSDALPTRVSNRLLAPAVLWTILLALTTTSIDGTVVGIVVYTPIGASMLSVGTILGGTADPPDALASATDPTV